MLRIKQRTTTKKQLLGSLSLWNGSRREDVRW